jgi:hypothetical protein
MPAAHSNSVPALIDRLVKQAKADPKKAGVLAVLVVVMGVMWARLGSGGSGGVARATAAPALSGFTAASAAADNRAAAARVNSAQASLDEFAKRQIVDVSRNLFVVNYDFFPQDGTRPAPAAPRLPAGAGFWDQVEKSIAVRADHKRDRAILIRNLIIEAEKLKVQSTVMGASPKAIVNGEMVGVGDVVALFRVSKIEARRVVVEREGIKLELRFN